MYVQEQNMNELFPGGAGPDASLIDWTTTTSPFGQTDEGLDDGPSPAATFVGYTWLAASLFGSIGGAYHGYKRNNNSIGWGIGWWFFGGILPIVAIPVMLVEGFGKRKGS